MRYLILAAGAALALGGAAYAVSGPATDAPACNASTSECAVPENGPYRRVDLQPGDCGASGLDCALPQYGPYRRL